MSASAVLAIGHHLPPRLVTNDELAGPLGVSARSLTDATGIARRFYAASGQGPSELAVLAAQAAGIAPREVEFIVFATMSPDVCFPGPGCYLQDKLGCDTVGALDIRAQCAGFLFALATADVFVRAGTYQRVLVAAGEVHSAALDYSPRAAQVTPYFGDGAGVLLLGAAESPGLLATVLHSDPTGLERFWCEFPASRQYPVRVNMKNFEMGAHYPVLDAAAVHAEAEERLVAVGAEVLGRAAVSPDQIALFVVHYFAPAPARRAAERARFPRDRVVIPAESVGHVAAAGIPIALAQAQASKRIRTGDLVCCLAYGAGMCWGGTVLRV